MKNKYLAQAGEIWRSCEGFEIKIESVTEDTVTYERLDNHRKESSQHSDFYGLVYQNRKLVDRFKPVRR